MTGTGLFIAKVSGKFSVLSQDISVAFKIDEPPSSFCSFHFIHSFIQMIFIRWRVTHYSRY